MLKALQVDLSNTLSKAVLLAILECVEKASTTLGALVEAKIRPVA